MSDQINLVVSAKSDGIKDLSKDLDAIVKSADDAIESTTKLAKSADSLSSSTTKASDQAAAYLQKITTQAETMGQSSEYTMSYIAALKGADEAQRVTAASIGAQIDAYRALNSAQTEAIAMNNSLTASQQRMAATATADIWMAEDAAIKAKIRDTELAVAAQKKLTAAQEQAKHSSTVAAWMSENKEIQANAKMLKQASAEQDAYNKLLKKRTDAATVSRWQEELNATKAQESAERSLIKAEQDYIKSLSERAAKTAQTTEASAAAIAKQRGYSEATIEQAKKLGKVIDEQEHNRLHGVKEFDASILRSGGVTREYMVLLHELYQGNISRLSGSMMVLAERTNFTQYIFSAAGLAVGGAAAAVAMLVFEMAKAHAQTEAFNNGVKLTSGYAGLTADNLNKMSESLATTHTPLNETRKMLTSLATAGQFTGGELKAVGEASIKLGHLTGQTAEEASKAFDGMKKDVTSWATNADEKYHFLSILDTQRIQELQEVGRNSEALMLVMDRMNNALDGQKEHVTILGGIWQGLGIIYSEVDTKLQKLFSDETKGEKVTKEIAALNKLKARLVEQQTTPHDDKDAASRVEQRIREAIKKQREVVKSAIDSANKEEIDAAKKQEYDLLQQKGNAAQAIWIAEEKANRTAKDQREHYAEDTRREAEEINAARIAAGSKKLITEAEIQKKLDDFNEKHKDKKAPSTRREDTDKYRAELNKIIGVIAEAEDQYNDVIADLNTKFKTQEISKFEVISKTAEAEKARHAEKIIQIQKEIDLSGKQKLEEKEVEKFNNDLAKEKRALARANVQEQQQVAVESHKIDKEITQFKIKELDAQGRYAEAARIKNIVDHQEELDLLKTDMEALEKLRMKAFTEHDDEGVERINTLLDLMKQKINAINKTGLELVSEAEFKQIKEIEKILERSYGKNSIGADSVKKQELTSKYEEDVKRINAVDVLKDPVIKGEEARKKILKDLEVQHAKDLNQVDQDRLKTQLDYAQSTADSLVTISQGLFGKQSGIAKAMFAADKAIAIARAVMNIEVAMSEAWKLPFPANLAAIADVAAGTANIVSSIQAVKGYEIGGYTGDGGTSQVAGVVHGQEFVVNAEGTRKNRAMLEAMNSGQSIAPIIAPQFAARSAGGTEGSGIKVHVENHGTDIQVMPLSEGEVRIIAKQIASSEVKKQTPSIVAGQLGYANSSISKALGRSTQTQRRRD